MRVGKRHILGPKSHVSIASLVEGILSVAKTEAELAALEAAKARLQRAREAEAACAQEEAERRAAAATAAATEEAEAKLQCETPPGGSRVETLPKLFEGDASSKMKLDLEEVDTGSSGDSGPTAYRRRRGEGKTPERAQRPAGGHPHDSDPFFTASDGDGRDRRHRRGMAGGGGGDVPMEPLQHDGREIRLRDWRDFWGQHTLFCRNVEDWNEGDEQARLLSMLPEAWIERVTKEEAKRAKFNHTFKMMLPREDHPNVLAWTKKHVARDVQRRELRNALLITVTGDREKTAMLRLDECDVGGQSLRLQAIPARITCDEVLELVAEEALKEYRNVHHTRGLKAGDRDVNYVGGGSGGEAAMDPAGTEAGEALDDEDDDDEPAETAVCAFVANNLNTGSNRGSWKPLQKGWKKKEKKEPRRMGDPPLSFGEFIRAHPQGCFVCYGRNKGFNRDHRTCPIHKADTEAYKKVHRSKKRAHAGIRETKVEVTKDELSKLMSVGTELAKEIQEIKRSWVPKSDNKNKDKDKKGKKGEKKKGVNEVDAEESTPTTTSDAP